VTSASGSTPRANTTVGASSRGIHAAFTPPVCASPMMDAFSNTLDDESMAREMAREEDEAFALSLAREQEADDAAMAQRLAGGFGGAYRAAPQMPWQVDDSLAAMIAAVSAADGAPGGMSGMGLEELFALMGNSAGSDAPARPHGPTRSQIQRLPTRTMTKDALSSLDREGGESECPVCFAGYDVGDELRTLPCMHIFHVECIDRWLTSGREASCTCPVCHSNIDL